MEVLLVILMSIIVAERIARSGESQGVTLDENFGKSQYYTYKIIRPIDFNEEDREEAGNEGGKI